MSRVVQKPPPGLMLTSLLDMFTIILIFLIVSFEAEDYNFKLNPDLKLPESAARSVFKPAVNIAITNGAILVGEEEVAKLEKGRLPAAMYDDGEVPNLVKLLKLYYEKIEERIAEEPVQDEAVEGSEEDNDPFLILIQGGRDLDYDTLYTVLRSASIAGFVKYRLAIMKQ